MLVNRIFCWWCLSCWLLLSYYFRLIVADMTRSRTKLPLLWPWSSTPHSVAEDWRTTLITPVFKNTTVQKSSDLFPSQVSSATCARSSHIVISSIMQYAEDIIIIAPEQHGFKCGRSCKTQLLGLITKISDLTHDFQAGKLVDLVGWTSPRPASQNVPL